MFLWETRVSGVEAGGVSDGFGNEPKPKAGILAPVFKVKVVSAMLDIYTPGISREMEGLMLYERQKKR
jgi:hypothetical protein